MELQITLLANLSNACWKGPRERSMAMFQRLLNHAWIHIWSSFKFLKTILLLVTCCLFNGISVRMHFTVNFSVCLLKLYMIFHLKSVICCWTLLKTSGILKIVLKGVYKILLSSDTNTQRVCATKDFFVSCLRSVLYLVSIIF